MGTAAAFFAATIISAGASMASGTTFLYSREDPEDTPAVTAVETTAQSAPDDDVYADGLLDLNAAGKDELIQLPGIGEVLAGRIIDYREEHGGFKSIEELLLIKGIGEKKYAELIKYITINSDREDINENSGS